MINRKNENRKSIEINHIDKSSFGYLVEAVRAFFSGRNRFSKCYDFVIPYISPSTRGDYKAYATDFYSGRSPDKVVKILVERGIDGFSDKQKETLGRILQWNRALEEHVPVSSSTMDIFTLDNLVDDAVAAVWVPANCPDPVKQARRAA